MAKLDGLGTVLEFLRGLAPKISNQIAKKVNAGLREGWEPVLHGLSRGLFDLNYKLGLKYAGR